MNREQKKQSVQEINSLIQNNSTVLIVYYQGLSAAKMHALRGVMIQSQAKFKVIKNSLAKLAISNTPAACVSDILTGPTAMIFTNEPASLVKNVSKFANENDKLIMIGGIVENQFVDKKAVEVLAKLPSKDELRAKLIGLLNAPATKLVTLISTPATNVARVINAYAESKK